MNEFWEWFVNFWNYGLFQVEEAWITPGKLTIALFAFIVGLMLSKIISRIIVARVLRGLKVGAGMSVVLSTLIHYTLVAAILLGALQFAGVPLTVFTIFGGALAIGIGFGSQHILANFISGLILLIERPVKPGDLVKVGDYSGMVVRVGARATLLTDYTGVTHLIPNSQLLESSVTNWHYDDDTVCAVTKVGAAYGTDTRIVEKLLLEVAQNHPQVSKEPAPVVLFEEFGSDSLNFELLVWIRARRVLERRKIESEIRHRINEIFNENGIVIAFPQRDVHLDSAKPIQVEVVK